MFITDFLKGSMPSVVSRKNEADAQKNGGRKIGPSCRTWSFALSLAKPLKLNSDPVLLPANLGNIYSRRLKNWLLAGFR
jgi:hypothetical protein